ncbi:Protein argonaute 2 [Camellia lanceoleosa]|uniref:Protein argonaute 2 n=1 Tax=Camellia lanceoleosa TaxID=1840588 RepID=A0ACC0GBV1_9ERIC|nr:Protein argonaute 2 [Camellia lanceoleosa]
MHYDVDIKPNMPPGSHAAKRPISKSDLRLITDKLFSDDPTRFPELISTYDGEKNIFSAVPLPTRTFYVELSVLDFLMEQGFQLNDVRTSRRELKGLKVHVTHRLTNQKYTLAGFSDQNTRDITFTLEDREAENPPREIDLVEYFKKKYNMELRYQDMPCMDLGKGNRKNYVPMEFCVLVDGQRYPKEHLDRDQALFLKQISLPRLRERKDAIYGMVRSEDGPCGDVSQNFEIEVEKNMTRVLGRVIEPPNLKLGTPNGNVNVLRINDRDKCQWNLLGKAVVGGKPLEHWALIDFSSYDRYRLNPSHFVQNLRNRCRNLGIRVEEPVVHRFTNMNEFSSIVAIQKLLHNVVEKASQKCKSQLQLIVYVMSARHDAYKYLKWVSETQIGVLTQCCLIGNANKGNTQYLANLALKINGKIGGSNVELNGLLPGFEGDEHVMFVGANVNLLGAFNASCPSIAAVVATINWLAANCYAARVCP